MLNATNGKTERIGRLLMMHANHREEIEECYAGDILAGVGLKQTSTGDTLAAPDAPVVLENIEFPEPVIAVAIEPKTKADQEKLGAGLARLAEEDPTFRIETDDETGQTLIHGMGELHLEVLVDRLLREFNVDANVGRPAGRLPRDDPRARREGRGPLRPPDGRPRPVRPRRHQRRARARGGLRLRQQDQGRRDPDRVHPRRRAGDRGGAGLRRQGRLPDGRRPGRAGRRLLPRRRLLGDGLQDRRLDGGSGGGPPREARPARARDGGRGRDARGVPRRRHRRPLAPPRQGAGPGAARQRARGRRRSCRSARCSATRPTCAPPPRARASYTMQFERYEEVPANIAEEIVEARSGEPVGAGAA